MLISFSMIEIVLKVPVTINPKEHTLWEIYQGTPRASCARWLYFLAENVDVMWGHFKQKNVRDSYVINKHKSNGRDSVMNSYAF